MDKHLIPGKDLCERGITISDDIYDFVKSRAGLREFSEITTLLNSFRTHTIYALNAINKEIPDIPEFKSLICMCNELLMIIDGKIAKYNNNNDIKSQMINHYTESFNITNKLGKTVDLTQYEIIPKESIGTLIKVCRLN